jgi:DNA-binding transcriptional LysR family regulator
MDAALMRYLPTFLEAASELNFSAAARKLGLTPAAISKSVRALESGLGVRLFHRSTHALVLTDEGTRLLREVGPLLDQIDTALEVVRASPEQPRGVLRVAAPYAFGKRFIVPLLAGFRARYPLVEFDLRFEDHVVDMIEAGIDVSFGLRFNASSNLVSKKLCDSRLFTVASPDFIDRVGCPQTPFELERYPCIRLRSASTGKMRPFMYRGEEGPDSPLLLDPPASTIGSDQELLCELAAEGLGIAMVGWVALPYIESGRLVPLLEAHSVGLPPMMIYYLSRQNLPPKVRVFIDYVHANLQRPTWPAPAR